MLTHHHLDCCSMCPPSRRWVNGEGSAFERARMVGHCLLAETSDGLVLVDTGIGLQDVTGARSRLGWGFWAMARASHDPARTAIRQIEALGYRAADVRHLVVTHLDVDHAGGIPDFPDATVHVLAPEHDAAVRRRGLVDGLRYRPAHWAHGPKWRLHEANGEAWMGFACARDLLPEVVLVPLVGHSRGHCGVAVRSGDRWLLHAGDAYFHRWELEDPPRRPKGLIAFERVTGRDWPRVLANQARLGELARGHPEISVFCAHDPVEFDRLASQRS